ncbi:hypothetical protein C2G38_2151562 [Gigaspora rosea]|uniref:Uncharacterized protein n=1 Tax=Gigaspora rosea TaxID=44941 RepID=A0A397W9D0_9GLOM|nr:hypothetical protein C2G38_2151562 [Gigaspora rosea]
MKRTNTTKEQEGKPQRILNQWFKGKSKEASTQLDSDLNNKKAESIEILLDNKILIVVGTYSVGVAKALNSKIYVTNAKRKVLLCQENPELEVLLTNNPHEASVHIMCLTKIKAEVY